MRVSTDRWLRRPDMPRLLDALDSASGETRFVGGCVRDAVLDLEDQDVDLATRLRPEAVLQRLDGAGLKAVPTGLPHGTITAVLPSGSVEITTLRRDVSTDGRRATIAYTDDWTQDAARRDFTINALSADASGAVHDYFGGLEDLERRRVRFIGDPLQRIAEDHLRILRFFRFHARFGADFVDPDALQACAARANDLMALSRERIADELLKLLALPRPEAATSLMIGNRILQPVLPEIDTSGLGRLEGLVRSEAEVGFEPDPLRRLASLLPADPEVAAAVAARLRLSNKAAKRLVSAASPAGAKRPEVLAFQLGRIEAIDRLLLEGRTDDAARLASWERPLLKLGGGDLIELGLPPGPIVARTFQRLEREWAEVGFPAEEDVQRALARKLVNQALLDSR